MSEDPAAERHNQPHSGGLREEPEDADARRRLVLTEGDAVARATGYPGRYLRERLEFADPKFEYRRLFSEFYGTFLLVLVAVGGGMVNAKFGGNVIPLAIAVTAPALMVGAVILFMGSVSGAHLNPGVSLAFAMRGDFPWKRVPGYIIVQFLGAMAATGLLILLIGKQGAAGLTLPGAGISPMTAMLWEALLTCGLVSVILGSSSGAQSVGPLAAIAVVSYIALAGMWGAPVSGASMNGARSLGPAIVLGNFTAWWAYLLGPLLGALIAVGIAWILRGRGGGYYGKKAAEGSLGWLWQPGPMAAKHGLSSSPAAAAAAAAATPAAAQAASQAPATSASD